MSEKEKPKRSTRLGFTRSCLAFALYPLLIFKLLAMGLVYWAVGGYVKPSLDPQYIPTAEYLLNTEMRELREDIDYHLSIGLYDTEFENNQICFDFSSTSMQDITNLRWAEIFLNEQIVSRYHPNWPEQTNRHPTYTNRICISGHLDSGLHIIEFRAKESLFAEPYYIQRWAIEIP